jgi:hypothetical protein
LEFEYTPIVKTSLVDVKESPVSVKEWAESAESLPAKSPAAQAISPLTVRV